MFPSFWPVPRRKELTPCAIIVQGDLAAALVARTRYKDSRREVSINTRKASDLESKGFVDKAEEARGLVAEGTKRMDADREELLRHFMIVEQRKPALQTVVQSYLNAQLQYHQQCLLSCDNALASIAKPLS